MPKVNQSKKNTEKNQEMREEVFRTTHPIYLRILFPAMIGLWLAVFLIWLFSKASFSFSILLDVIVFILWLCVWLWSAFGIIYSWEGSWWVFARATVFSPFVFYSVLAPLSSIPFLLDLTITWTGATLLLFFIIELIFPKRVEQVRSWFCNYINSQHIN